MAVLFKSNVLKQFSMNGKVEFEGGWLGQKVFTSFARETFHKKLDHVLNLRKKIFLKTSFTTFNLKKVPIKNVNETIF